MWMLFAPLPGRLCLREECRNEQGSPRPMAFATSSEPMKRPYLSISKQLGIKQESLESGILEEITPTARLTGGLTSGWVLAMEEWDWEMTCGITTVWMTATGITERLFVEMGSAPMSISMRPWSLPAKIKETKSHSLSTF